MATQKAKRRRDRVTKAESKPEPEPVTPLEPSFVERLGSLAGEIQRRLIQLVGEIEPSIEGIMNAELALMAAAVKEGVPLETVETFGQILHMVMLKALSGEKRLTTRFLPTEDSEDASGAGEMARSVSLLLRRVGLVAEFTSDIENVVDDDSGRLEERITGYILLVKWR